MHTKNLLGKRYGRLTVTKFLFSERVVCEKRSNSHTDTYWECTCECGNKIKALTRLLNSGDVKSCGCLPNSIQNTPDTNFTELYNRYLCRARRKNLEFVLSKDKFKELTKMNCYYCGEEPSQIVGKDRIYPYVYNGLDRLDNSKGYTEDNVVPCCGTCNKMKLSMSVKEFEQQLLKIANHRKLL